VEAVRSSALQIDSFKTVAFTAAFLMPGFIWSAVLSFILPRRSGQVEQRFLEFFTLSCVNNALWFWLFAYFYLTGYPTQRPKTFALFILLALFISPVVLGLISGHLAQHQYVALALRRLGFRTVHYIPTAWDWHFSRQEALWARVTLKDGSAISGYFGGQSFASSDPDERDIYLEEVYTQTTQGIRRVERTRGCLISAEQISVIEFFRVEAQQRDDKERQQRQTDPDR
jgi:hypothetical protein